MARTAYKIPSNDLVYWPGRVGSPAFACCSADEPRSIHALGWRAASLFATHWLFISTVSGKAFAVLYFTSCSTCCFKHDRLGHVRFGLFLAIPSSDRALGSPRSHISYYLWLSRINFNSHVSLLPFATQRQRTAEPPERLCLISACFFLPIGRARLYCDLVSSWQLILSPTFSSALVASRYPLANLFGSGCA